MCRANLNDYIVKRITMLALVKLCVSIGNVSERICLLITLTIFSQSLF